MKWKCPKCGNNKLVHLEDYVTVENPIDELDGRLVVDYDKVGITGEDTEHRIMCDSCGEIFDHSMDCDEILSLSCDGIEIWNQEVED